MYFLSPTPFVLKLLPFMATFLVGAFVTTQTFVTEACGTTSFQKNRPKIRSNLTWQIEHVFGQSTCQKSVQKTKQAARGDDRRGTRSAEA